jgi:hypothetical protein
MNRRKICKWKNNSQEVKLIQNHLPISKKMKKSMDMTPIHKSINQNYMKKIYWNKNKIKTTN